MITFRKRIFLLSQVHRKTGSSTSLHHGFLAPRRRAFSEVRAGVWDYISGPIVSNIVANTSLLPSSTKFPLSSGRDQVEDLDLYGDSDCFEDPSGEVIPVFRTRKSWVTDLFLSGGHCGSSNNYLYFPPCFGYWEALTDF